MKKKLSIILFLIIILGGLFVGCNGNKSKDKNEVSDDRLKIVTTLFPQYDFTRQLVGDKADVALLMEPGVESHSYEPSPADIIKINEADLFIYTGEHMEPWAKSIIDGIENKNVKILDISQGINLTTGDDTHHEHEDEKNNLEEKHIGGEFDPHIWTTPVNAKKIVNNILEKICELDPENADFYKENGDEYCQELDQLHKEFEEILQNAKRHEIIFAGKFPLKYFAKEYGIEYKAAFDSCASETEPSVKKVTELINEIKEKDIPVVYYPELTDPKVAKSIIDETGGEMLLLHSCHNVSKDEFKAGETYLSLMKKNADNLRVGLN